jgi:urease accessory protein UreF
MAHMAHPASREAVESLGELHPLLAQLGSADGLFALRAASASLRLTRLDSPDALATFLHAYCGRVLLPLDLPAIERAYRHASRHEIRELIALDREIARAGLLRDFAAASRRAGRNHLQRLRPLRGERVAQRYLQAVEDGAADGWHTIVYGLTLALYSLPIRQGLMNYAHQTLHGFISVAARPLRLSKHQATELLEELCLCLPAQLESLLAGRKVKPRRL